MCIYCLYATNPEIHSIYFCLTPFVCEYNSIIWRVAQGQYNLLGLLAPYTAQLKMIMRDLRGEENKVQRDDPTPSNVVERFKQVIGGLSDLRNISFPRSIQPSHELKGLPMLLVFDDGSLDAYCVVAYAAGN